MSIFSIHVYITFTEHYCISSHPTVTSSSHRARKDAEVSLDTHLLVPCVCPTHRKLWRWLSSLRHGAKQWGGIPQEDGQEGNEATPALEAPATHLPSFEVALLGCQEGAHQQGWKLWGDERFRDHVRVREELWTALLYRSRWLGTLIISPQPTTHLPYWEHRTPTPSLACEDCAKASIRVRYRPSARRTCTTATICDDTGKKNQEGGASDGCVAPPIEIADGQEEGESCFEGSMPTR